MSNPVRILIVILCALTLWYLVIRLARGVDEEEVGALPGAGTFRFHTEINFDDVLVSGQKLQYAGAVDVTVRRPAGVPAVTM